MVELKGGLAFATLQAGGAGVFHPRPKDERLPRGPHGIDNAFKAHAVPRIVSA